MPSNNPLVDHAIPAALLSSKATSTNAAEPPCGTDVPPPVTASCFIQPSGYDDPPQSCIRSGHTDSYNSTVASDSILSPYSQTFSNTNTSAVTTISEVIPPDDPEHIELSPPKTFDISEDAAQLILPHLDRPSSPPSYEQNSGDDTADDIILENPYHSDTDSALLERPPLDFYHPMSEAHANWRDDDDDSGVSVYPYAASDGRSFNGSVDNAVFLPTDEDRAWKMDAWFDGMLESTALLEQVMEQVYLHIEDS